MKFIVEIAAGCHGKPIAPIISEHKSWEAAKTKALKSDRWIAVNKATGERFQIPMQNDKKYGYGRYGNGITPSQARKLGIMK